VLDRAKRSAVRVSLMKMNLHFDVERAGRTVIGGILSVRPSSAVVMLNFNLDVASVKGRIVSVGRRPLVEI